MVAKRSPIPLTEPESVNDPIDDAIDAWAADPDATCHLWEYLGMQRDEFVHWVETGQLPKGSPYAAKGN